MRCWFKYPNERNPYCQLHVSGETAGHKPEEGEDDVKSAWPLYLGLHTRYNGRNNGMPSREAEPIPQIRPQFRLQAATRLHEVGVASKRASAIVRWIRSRVLYTPPVTLWELVIPEAGSLTARKAPSKVGLVTGVKS